MDGRTDGLRPAHPRRALQPEVRASHAGAATTIQGRRTRVRRTPACLSSPSLHNRRRTTPRSGLDPGSESTCTPAGGTDPPPGTALRGVSRVPWGRPRCTACPSGTPSAIGGQRLAEEPVATGEVLDGAQGPGDAHGWTEAQGTPTCGVTGARGTPMGGYRGLGDTQRWGDRGLRDTQRWGTGAWGRPWVDRSPGDAQRWDNRGLGDAHGWGQGPGCPPEVENRDLGMPTGGQEPRGCPEVGDRGLGGTQRWGNRSLGDVQRWGTGAWMTTLGGETGAWETGAWGTLVDGVGWHPGWRGVASRMG